MRYMLLLHVPSEVRERADLRAPMEAWWAYNEALRDAGAFIAGDALQDLDTAHTVRVRDGEQVVTDGPFAETKEMLGGYYLIDVPDLDAALGWAAKVPNAPYGSVEVRPIMEIPAAAGQG
jgi:hypothetical protein